MMYSGILSMNHLVKETGIIHEMLWKFDVNYKKGMYI